MKRLIRILVILLVFCSAVLLVFKYAEEITQLKKAVYTYVSKDKSEDFVPKDFDQMYSSFAPFVHAEDAWYQGTNLVHHAGSGIDGLRYSNSKEALDAALLKGNVIEVDFIYTEDGVLVCGHDWKTITDTEDVPVLSEFLSLKIFGKYTPMTAEDLIGFLSENKEVYLVIDTKEKNEEQVIQDLITMAKEPEIIERFIIQLYTEGMKQTILQMYPFPDENFLFTCYKYGDNYKGVLSVCMKENISVVTLPYDYWEAEVIDMFTQKGIVLFEHTVNRLDRIRKSKEKGITKFYTDFITEDVFSETE